MLPKNFQPKEGVRLTDNLVVGGHISSGLQGGVYDLLTPDGKKANMVFKVNSFSLSGYPVQAFALVDMYLHFHAYLVDWNGNGMDLSAYRFWRKCSGLDSRAVLQSLAAVYPVN